MKTRKRKLFSILISFTILETLIKRTTHEKEKEKEVEKGQKWEYRGCRVGRSQNRKIIIMVFGEWVPPLLLFSVNHNSQTNELVLVSYATPFFFSFLRAEYIWNCNLSDDFSYFLSLSLLWIKTSNLFSLNNDRSVWVLILSGILMLRRTRW